MIRAPFQPALRPTRLLLSIWKNNFCSSFSRFTSENATAALASAASKKADFSGKKIRNIAVIAHVDHGKTSLVDCLLKGGDLAVIGMENESRVMDSEQLEKERGITILSKTASVSFDGYHINIVDTPGHTDFGGEVERVLSMVDGVLLVVDATEGPMTQTRYVLSKALNRGIKPIVVINKCDRPTTRIPAVESEILDLFLDLEAQDHQLDYPTVYTSAKSGWATLDVSSIGGISTTADGGMKDLLRTIINHVPPPNVNPDDSFRMLVVQLQNDRYVGRCILGRIDSGRIKLGDSIKALSPTGELVENGKLQRIFVRKGLELVTIESADAGDIVWIAGLPKAPINATVCSLEVDTPIHAIPIDPPTVAMTFSVNDSPFQAQEGSKLTSNMIRDRLYKEIETNVAMQIVETDQNEAFEVRGRGELHLGILIENMRREGFELSVSPPRVLFKTVDGVIMEPVEEAIIDVPEEMSGNVIQKLTKRKGELQTVTEQLGNIMRLHFVVPSRGILGYPAEFKNDTSGQGVFNHVFLRYEPFKGEVDKSRKGSLISTASGTVTAHAALALEPRGQLFVKPSDAVYVGQIIGEHNKWMDLEVNPVKAKHLSNVRAASKDDFVKISPPRIMPLEQILSYIQDDEIVEVTPTNIRIRKRHLDPSQRKPKK